MNVLTTYALGGGGVFAAKADWDRLGPVLWTSLGQTMFMVSVALVVGGILGLVVGLGLYATRSGNLASNRAVFSVLNLCVNIVRPIPFIIFIALMGPVTMQVVGTTIGTGAATFPMSIMAGFAFSRLVEQNLIALDPGVIEAARAMGASRWRIVWTVLIPEALSPLILGYTFLFVGVIDMSVMAGMIGGGGLGDFAIRYGYQRYTFEVTLVAVVVIVIIVQVVQVIGNSLARKMLRR